MRVTVGSFWNDQLAGQRWLAENGLGDDAVIEVVLDGEGTGLVTRLLRGEQEIYEVCDGDGHYGGELLFVHQRVQFRTPPPRQILA